MIAGVVTLWLPETIYANMHQTIEEAESCKEDFSIPCCMKTTPIERTSLEMNTEKDNDEKEIMLPEK